MKSNRWRINLPGTEKGGVEIPPSLGDKWTVPPEALNFPRPTPRRGAGILRKLTRQAEGFVPEQPP